MRFLFNSTYYKPAKGGGGPIASVSGLGEALVERGHDVTVVASDLDIPGRIDVDTTRDHEINGVTVRYFRALPSILQRTRIPMFAAAKVYTFGSEFHSWLATIAPQSDVFVSHMPYTWSNTPCSLASQRHRKKYLYYQRGNFDPVRLRIGRLKKALYIALYEKPATKLAHALIALNNYETLTFRALGMRNRIEIIPNGVIPCPPALPDAISPRIVSIIRELGDGHVFLFMSRISRTKGPDMFIRAFCATAKAHPEARAVLVGPDEDQLLKGILEEAASAGMQDRVVYAGIVSGADKWALLKRAETLVLPTISEGFSMAILEGMSAGCAVMTTPEARFPEIESSGSGWIIPRTLESFTSAMTNSLISGIGATRNKGQQGQRLVTQNYTWPAIAERFENLCLDLTGIRHNFAV